jgi:periplasmic protein TonB
MFEQTFVDGTGSTKKPWTVAVSFLIQLTLVAIAVILPLIFTDSLPRAQLTSFLVAPPPPPPPPPPPAAMPEIKVVKVIPRQFDDGQLLAPKEIPKEVAMIKEEEMPPPSAGVGVQGGVPGGVPGGAMGGVLGGIIGSVPSAAPPPPPPPPEKPKTPSRIRVGGSVQEAKLVRKIMPQYPPLAKQARIQGTVRLNAIIGRDGAIQNLQLVSGHPLLSPSAIDAVKRWVYQPTLLNGEPVEVVTVIDVNFTLSQ